MNFNVEEICLLSLHVYVFAFLIMQQNLSFMYMYLKKKVTLYMYIILHKQKYISRKLQSCNQYNMISINTTLMVHVLEFLTHKLQCKI